MSVLTQDGTDGGQQVADVVERLLAEFEHTLDLNVVSDTVLACHRSLDCASDLALPELLERLARQRLIDLLARRPTVS